MPETSIEWTDATWNPIAGCTITTKGCTNCYAMRLAARLEAMGVKKYRNLTRKSGDRYVWTGNLSLDQSALALPKSWKKPRQIFVNSMSDMFHEKVPDDFIINIWNTMMECPQHIFQILTKRSERMNLFLRSGRVPKLSNVWLGTSVEDSYTLDRLDDLRQTPAAIRFVSFEPLLGSVSNANLTDIDWAIVGGESGPRARQLQEKWVDEIHDLCVRSGTTFFFKQWGGTNKKTTGRIYRGRTWDDLPALSI